MMAGTDVRKVDRLLRDVAATPGWQVRRTTKGHVLITSPSGKTCGFSPHSLKAGARAVRNIKALHELGWQAA